MPIAEVFASIFGGGLTGLIGTITQRVFEFKTKKLEIQENLDKYAHEVEMRKADAEIMAQEWAAKTKIADTEAQVAVDSSDAAAFSAALTSEPKRYTEGSSLTPVQAWLMVLLDFLRGFIRPFLTLYLCGVTTLVYLQAHRLLASGSVTPADSLDLTKIILHTVLYLTTTCVLFWFGTRNKQKAPTV